MRKHTVLLLAVMICGAFSLASAQKKPARQQRPAQKQAGPQNQNKQLARRVFEELNNQGRYGEVDQVFDRNCKVHFGNRTLGLSQAVAEGKGWKSAAPDFSTNVENVTENGDKVTVFWSAQGTHTGPGLGVKPTRKQVSMRDKTVFQFKNGKIVEAWNSEYRQELFRQLGVSKTAASMFDNAEKLWAAAAQLFPDPLYTSLQ